MSIKTTIFKILYTLNKRAYYQLRYWLARKRFANLKRPSNLSEFLLSEMLKPEFKNYSQFAENVLDIFEEVSGAVELDVKYDPDAFNSISIKEVYDI